MSRRVPTALFVTLAGMAGCSSSAPRDAKDAAGGATSQPHRASVRFQIATLEQRADYIAMVDSTARVIYVSPDPEFNERDVATARAFHGEAGSFVEVTFRPDAARRLARVTGENIGQQLAIVVDGKLISAPVIRDPIDGGRAYISGQFTQQQAEELAQSLGGP